MQPVPAEDLELAASLAREGGELAARMLADGLETRLKTSIHDVVSDADLAVERLITTRLLGDRPGDGLVGEEGARGGEGERTWYVDPVDGTYNFLSGTGVWCCAIGLADQQGPLLGVVYHPLADELWVGGRGRATTCNGTPVPTLTGGPLAEKSVGANLSPRRLSRAGIADTQPVLDVIAQAATVRMFGCCSVELAAVSAGRLGSFVNADLNPWDWVPGAALVEAAGGTAAVFEAGGRRYQVAGGRDTVAEICDVITASVAQLG